VTTPKVRLEIALASWLTVAGPAWAALAIQDQLGQQKEDSPLRDAEVENNKAGSKKKPQAPGMVNLDFKITVEGMDALPPDSTADLKGLEACEATGTARVNPDGSGRFPKVPRCKVQLKIFITGMDTGIVTVDAGKQKDFPVLIRMKSSGEATVLNP